MLLGTLKIPELTARYWLEPKPTGGGGVRVPVGSNIFTSPYRPDRLWDPPNLL
jgi:hypothetical protein